jgi:transposase
VRNCKHRLNRRDFVIDAHERGETVPEIASALHLSSKFVSDTVNRLESGKAGLQYVKEIPYVLFLEDV